MTAPNTTAEDPRIVEPQYHAARLHALIISLRNLDDTPLILADEEQVNIRDWSAAGRKAPVSVPGFFFHQKQSDVASVVVANSISISMNSLGSVAPTMPTSAPVTTFQFRRFGRRLLASSAWASLSSRKRVISLLPAPSHVSIIKTFILFLRMRR